MVLLSRGSPKVAPRSSSARRRAVQPDGLCTPPDPREGHLTGPSPAASYVDLKRIDGYYSRTYVVPDGSVLVMGDNRANSTDSRDDGPVDTDDITGRVLLRLWTPVRR